jgi:hypothetical protein
MEENLRELHAVCYTSTGSFLGLCADPCAKNAGKHAANPYKTLTFSHLYIML